MYRGAFVVLFAGCGFHVSGGTPGGDAAANDAALDVLANGDAMLVDAPPDTIDAPPPHVCAGYVSVAAAGTQSTYKAFSGTAWANARTRCETDTAYLMVPETSAEARAIYTLVNPDPGSPFYWGGLTRSGTGVVDIFSHTTANPPWGSGQPNGGTADPILIDVDGLYYDFNANAPQQYACECAPSA